VTSGRATSDAGTAEEARPGPVGPRLDSQGRYVAWASWSYATLGFYVFLILVLFYINGRTGSYFLYPQVPLLLAVVIGIYLGRYLSTYYILDNDYLHARRLFGSRRLRLESIFRIRFASLRELAPVGIVGSWGWRGRMWSPIGGLGSFDTLHTMSAGVLVSGDGVPMFLSPKDPAEFARELSRRVRSAGVVLDEDDGALA
jgi:hypothetical protein